MPSSVTPRMGGLVEVDVSSENSDPVTLPSQITHNSAHSRMIEIDYHSCKVFGCAEAKLDLFRVMGSSGGIDGQCLSYGGRVRNSANRKGSHSLPRRPLHRSRSSLLSEPPWVNVVSVTRKKATPSRSKPSYDVVLADVVEMIEAARQASA